MLLALSIRDFVIVERLELEFEEGFTVLTGETGAGKSILIDALQFVLGERTQADAVREGCARAEISAEFRSSAPVHEWLLQAGFDAGAEAAPASVLLRRTLESSGRSRCFVNGSMATQAQVRELGELLLDVHGQHEHQLLLRPAAQQQLLDNHGRLHPAAQAVAAAHAGWRGAARALEEAQAASAQSAALAELLRQQVEELGALAPLEGEWEQLGQEQKRLAHGAALLEGARAALEALDEGPEAVSARLARQHTRLSGLQAYDPHLAGIVESLASAQIQIGEAARELGHYLAAGDTDEGRLAQLDERIADLHAAARKWRCPPTELPAMLGAARARLGRLAEGSDIAALQAAVQRAADAYQEQALSLSRARQAAARDMGREVTRAMQDLAMEGGRFEVRLVPTEPSAAGLEKIEFLVSAHAAGTARPLAKVASGGELSRIGLAIAVIAASANPTPTLIFDEVDAGIGGQVAATVGRLLRELGASRQVFCVTHLPQVAACGQWHLAVRKAAAADGRPLSRTETLAAEARVQEIARMLGGAQITAVTQKHAREMLRQPY